MRAPHPELSRTPQERLATVEAEVRSEPELDGRCKDEGNDAHPFGYEGQKRQERSCHEVEHRRA